PQAQARALRRRPRRGGGSGGGRRQGRRRPQAPPAQQAARPRRHRPPFRPLRQDRPPLRAAGALRGQERAGDLAGEARGDARGARRAITGQCRKGRVGAAAAPPPMACGVRRPQAAFVALAVASAAWKSLSVALAFCTSRSACALWWPAPGWPRLSASSAACSLASALAAALLASESL